MELDFEAADGENLLQKHQIGLKISEARDLQKKLGRKMTLTEATIFGIQLSEHCSYKTSKKFLQDLPTDAPQVILGPGQDGGMIEIFEENGEKYGIVLGHESHNHPSQVVPFEGAATGVGGIIRDILCMGARPCGVADSLRFGRADKITQKNIASGAVAGIAGYANPLGVPNLGGDVFFDADFDENCLVNVTAIGSARESDLIDSFVPPNAGAENWDLLIVGKATDNSGFGGASFASGSFEASEDLNSKRAAVQQPNPFLERHLVASFLDLFGVLKSENLMHKFRLKDLGAGGVVCATVEICEAGGAGAEIFLEQLHRMADFPPHVLACSETQERFCIACHPDLTERICAHFAEKWALGSVAEKAGISKIGRVRDDGNYVVKWGDETLCNASASLITAGISYDREFEIPEIADQKCPVSFANGEILVG